MQSIKETKFIACISLRVSISLLDCVILQIIIYSKFFYEESSVLFGNSLSTGTNMVALTIALTEYQATY